VRLRRDRRSILLSAIIEPIIALLRVIASPFGRSADGAIDRASADAGVVCFALQVRLADSRVESAIPRRVPPSVRHNRWKSLRLPRLRKDRA